MKKFGPPERPSLADADLLVAIREYVVNHPGVDAEDVARKFSVPLARAINLTDYLLAKGLIDFAKDGAQ